jgi:hypothetical protein
MEPSDHPAAEEESDVDPDWDNVTHEYPRLRALAPVNPVIADQDAIVQTPLNKIEQRPSSEEVQDQCRDADADGTKRQQAVRPDVLPGADDDGREDLKDVPGFRSTVPPFFLQIAEQRGVILRGDQALEKARRERSRLSHRHASLAR